MTRGRPRSGRWGWAGAVVVPLLVVVAAAVWASSFLLVPPGTESAATAREPALGSGAASDGQWPSLPASAFLASPRTDALPVFAVSDGVALRLVSPRAVAVAFHEASYRDAVPLRPRGECQVCRNPRFRLPRGGGTDLSYMVMDTRARGTPAASAADVVLPRDELVLAPVSGTVTRVRPYRLYGRHRDLRVEIRPRGRPDRRVVLLHLAGVRIAPGASVEAAVTELGRVRAFSFRSQVDRYVDGGHPHVHLEVKDPAARRKAKR